MLTFIGAVAGFMLCLQKPDEYRSMTRMMLGQNGYDDTMAFLDGNSQQSKLMPFDILESIIYSDKVAEIVNADK